MKDYYTKLVFGNYYHIYNRGINSGDIFHFNEDYEHFYHLYEKYIDPIAETFAWVYLKNHFHFLVRVKDEEEIGYFKSLTNKSYRYGDSVGLREENKWKFVQDLPKSSTEGTGRVKKPNPSRQFSHLFNSYAKYFNKKYQRHGSLFERPFKRLIVDNKKYLTNLIIYIHQNPVFHGFVEHILDYPWSSYLALVLVKPTRFSQKTVLGWFDDLGNFKAVHKIEINDNDLGNLVIE
jgi:REP element-mobilizing transposase RayT